MKRIFGYLPQLLAASVLAAQTGPGVPELTELDRAVSAILTKYKVPGAAVSIAKDGKLVYSRGFGTADVETNEAVQPDSLFRVASVSKPLTAMGVLKLGEEGKLSLDTKVLPFIGRTSSADVRWGQVTVRHLLQHSGGLDMEFWGFDPSFPDRPTLQALGASLPPSRSDVLDFVLDNLPLASVPGTKYAYSNIGYMLLTEVIEKASGQKYETYMRERILAPIGISRMRIAGSLLTDRQAGEVRYWDKNRMGESIFESLTEEVPLPYGSFHLRIFESGGGWLATAPDLVRFLAAFDGGSGYQLLRPETLRSISERPGYVPASATSWYGLGWQIERGTAGERWDHDGAFQGSSAWMFRGVNGISFAIAANHLPDDEVLEAFFEELEKSFQAALLAVNRWPAGDTFPTYFPDRAPRISGAGVVNAASLRPGAAGAESVVRIFGVNLSGGRVLVNGAMVDTLWSEAGDLHVGIPQSAGGSARFQVMRDGLSSNVVSIAVAAAAPGIFTLSRNGYGQAAALNQDGSVNGAATAAAAGSIVVLYATGAGMPTVTIGGQAAQVLFSGQAPGLVAGISQINVRLGAGIAKGNAEVIVKSGEARSQAGVTIAVQ